MGSTPGKRRMRTYAKAKCPMNMKALKFTIYKLDFNLEKLVESPFRYIFLGSPAGFIHLKLKVHEK